MTTSGKCFVKSRKTAKSGKPAESGERGFALLIVFLFAAIVSFSLYQQMPRVAFESAREKEQLLIDRGNQYKRAIQVFYAVNKKYPAKIEDLEKTNDQRFLRRRYKDPMTGKDEWRLIHTDGTNLTDSLVTKPGGTNAQNTLPGGGPLGTNNLNTAQAGANNSGGTGSGNNNNTDPQGQAAVNPAAARRPSDRGTPQGNSPSQGFNPTTPLGPNGLAYDPNDPRTWPAISLAQPTQPGQAGTNVQRGNAQGNQPGQYQPGQYQPGQFQPGQPVQLNPTGGFAPGGQPSFNPNNPQQLGPTGLPLNNGNNGVNPATDYPGPPPNAQTSPFPAGANNPALALIGAQLTNPNQNQGAPPIGGAGTGLAVPGAGGINPTNSPFQTGQTPTGQPVAGQLGAGGGPGIAGVASQFKGPSIKSYHERLKYQEWEFVYLPAQGTPAPAQAGNPLGSGQPGQSQPGQSQPNQPQVGQPSGTGLFGPTGAQNPTGTNSSPFGLPAQVQ